MLVVLRQIRRHMHRAVEHHVGSELPRQGSGHPALGFRSVGHQVDDPGREVHGTRQHARKDQGGHVVDRIGGCRPGVVLLAAGALAGQPVRIGAAQAGVLDRLMTVDGDAMLRRGFQHADKMIHRVLAVVPFPARHALLIQSHQFSGIGNVAGLDLADAEAAVQGEGVFQLRFVVAEVSGSFVMPYQPHTALAAVRGDRLDVKVGVGSGEAEHRAICQPVAVPTGVPAFHQHPIEAVLSGEVHVGERTFGSGAVARPAAPGVLADMHTPPDADVLARFHPGHIPQLIGLIEVDHQV